MHKRDEDQSHFETGGNLATELANKAGSMNCASGSFVYRADRE